MNLLKDVKAYYKVEDNVYIELTKEEFYMELHKSNERLQKRIDKAIEYIEKEILDYPYNDDHIYEDGKQIINILKGEE